MMRQPDGYVLVYRTGVTIAVAPASFERLVRGRRVIGFWRVYLRRDRR